MACGFIGQPAENGVGQRCVVRIIGLRAREICVASWSPDDPSLGRMGCNRAGNGCDIGKVRTAGFEDS